MSGQEEPSAEEIWRVYCETAERTGDRGYGSTAEYFRSRGHGQIDHEHVRRVCEVRRLRREGWRRLGHHLAKGLAPGWWCSRLWALELRLRGVQAGAGLYCKGRVDIERNGGTIRLGKRVEIGKLTLLQTAPAGELVVGDDVQINRLNYIGAGARVEIADHCVLAPYVRILDSEHRFRQREVLIKNARGYSEPVYIGRGAWLGFGVSVLKGAVIGEGAVIGAHAVVRGEVPPFAIAVGAPARVVGYRE